MEVFVLTIDTAYNYEVNLDVRTFDTKAKALSAMRSEYDNIRSNSFGIDDWKEEFTEDSIECYDDGSYTQNHICLTIHETELQ